jgi:hypothetical protein
MCTNTFGRTTKMLLRSLANWKRVLMAATSVVMLPLVPAAAITFRNTWSALPTGVTSPSGNANGAATTSIKINWSELALIPGDKTSVATLARSYDLEPGEKDPKKPKKTTFILNPADPRRFAGTKVRFKIDKQNNQIIVVLSLKRSFQQASPSQMTTIVFP